MYFALEMKTVLGVGDCVYTGVHETLMWEEDEEKEREVKQEQKEPGEIRRNIVDSRAREAFALNSKDTFKIRKATWKLK